mmetsp:Transcript_43638/g.124465  ORF Transcript_43638/g.124465 Transcript_43638/m.124465 type:complete len:208 (-) Transcript_43638:127-750(-)
MLTLSSVTTASWRGGRWPSACGAARTRTVRAQLRHTRLHRPQPWFPLIATQALPTFRSAGLPARSSGAASMVARVAHHRARKRLLAHPWTTSPGSATGKRAGRPRSRPTAASTRERRAVDTEAALRVLASGGRRASRAGTSAEQADVAGPQVVAHKAAARPPAASSPHTQPVCGAPCSIDYRSAAIKTSFLFLFPVCADLRQEERPA